MTHTPGPWKVNLDRDYAPAGEEGELITVDVIKAEPMPPGYPVIAEMINSPFEDDEVIANARLIAAAPDMLEVLKELMEQINDDAVTAMFHIDLQNRANEYIAKAEGK